MLSSRGRGWTKFPPSLPGAAPPLRCLRSLDPCMSSCLWNILSHKDQGGFTGATSFPGFPWTKSKAGRGQGLEEPMGSSSSLSCHPPQLTVQAVGWPAWPFRALILARK